MPSPSSSFKNSFSRMLFFPPSIILDNPRHIYIFRFQTFHFHFLHPLPQRNQRSTIVSIPISPTNSVFNSIEIEVVCHGERERENKTKNGLPRTTMGRNLVHGVEMGKKKVEEEKFSNLFSILLDTSHNDNLIRQFGEVSGADERSARGKKMNARRLGYSFRVCLHYHTYCVAIANQASSVARFSHFPGTRAASTIPTGSRFMERIELNHRPRRIAKQRWNRGWN